MLPRYHSTLVSFGYFPWEWVVVISQGICEPRTKVLGRVLGYFGAGWAEFPNLLGRVLRYFGAGWAEFPNLLGRVLGYLRCPVSAQICSFGYVPGEHPVYEYL